MKRSVPFFAVIMLSMMSASCKKDYNCTCTVTDPGSDPETITFSIPKTTKTKATNKCKEAETTLSIGSTAACKI